MVNKIFYLIPMIAMPILSFSQEKHVKGYVKDLNTNQGLSGVTVGNSKKAVISEESGYFSISLSSSDEFLQFKLIGYEDTIVSLESNALLVVYMKETSYLLGTSVVSSSRFEKPLASSTISMNVIKADLPLKLNSYSSKQVLAKVPGVQIIDGQANIRGGSGYSYGAGSRVLVMMDDLPVLQPDAGSSNWDDLPLENLAQIEVLKGAASALYGSAAMNGIIHFRSSYPGSDPYTSAGITYTFYGDPGGNRAWWKDDPDQKNPYETFLTILHRQKLGSNDIVLSSQLYDRVGYNKDVDARTGRINLLWRKRIKDKIKIGLGFNFNVGKSSNFFYWKDEGLFASDSTATSHTDKLRFTIDPNFSLVGTIIFETMRIITSQIKVITYIWNISYIKHLRL
jgi:hypothetical protein